MRDRPTLQRRQRRLLQHLIEGDTIADIARREGRPIGYVHRSAAFIRRRLGARSTAHMVALAIGAGLVKLPHEQEE